VAYFKKRLPANFDILTDIQSTLPRQTNAVPQGNLSVKCDTGRQTYGGEGGVVDGVHFGEGTKNELCLGDGDGFGGLVVSMLASGSRVRGFEPDRSRWIFSDVKKSSPCFPSEGK
jgi:hypothetical protein